MADRFTDDAVSIQIALRGMPTEERRLQLLANILRDMETTAAAAEREACAKVAETATRVEGIGKRIAAAIRARGEKADG